MSPEPRERRGALLDTCAFINLAVMPCGGRLLAGLPHDFHVPDQVIHEAIDPRWPHQDRRALLLGQLVRCTMERTSEYHLFGELVSREGRRALGDGEAAVMALGHLRGMLIVTDDGPAMEVMAAELGARSCTSIGLIRSGVRLRVVTESEAHAGITAALTEARMAIQDADIAWVAELLGEEFLGQHRHLGDLHRRLTRIRGR